jgi:hypothetical protein
MAKSHAPPLQINQYFAYLRDHLLLGQNADIQADHKTISQEVQRDVFPVGVALLNRRTALGGGEG